MRKLLAFNFITLDGFYKGLSEDISWHRHGEEESAFAADNMKGEGAVLLFGRTTYHHMASFWRTPQAIKNIPEVAAGMNSAEKIVFSNTLKKADWNNTTVIGGDIVSAVRKLKRTEGKDM